MHTSSLHIDATYLTASSRTKLQFRVIYEKSKYLKKHNFICVCKTEICLSQLVLYKRLNIDKSSQGHRSEKITLFYLIWPCIFPIELCHDSIRKLVKFNFHPLPRTLLIWLFSDKLEHLSLIKEEHKDMLWFKTQIAVQI